MMVVACGLLLVLGLWCLREWFEVGWNDWAKFRISSVAIAVEAFRHDYERYPDRLSELLTNEFQDEKVKKTIARLISDSKDGSRPETLTYKASSNGFTLIITCPELPPTGWFGKQRRVERYYAVGEALK